MSFALLDTAVMLVDLPQHGLKCGDMGAVVHVYSPDRVEVEFVRAAGHTQALVTLAMDQLRPLGPRDQLAVRQIDAA
jgi:transcription elongation factor GreA-like protein